MSLAPVLVCLVGQATIADKPTLELYQDTFVVRQGESVERIPISTTPKPAPSSVLFRRDRTFVAWDERGLTVRVKDRVYSTRMSEIAVTPKLFSKEEIRKTLYMVAAGTREKEADALSGSKRIGNNVYLLPRWDDGSGKPWLEALVSLDLTSPLPKPKLLGRYDGMTLSKKPIDEQLFVQDDLLGVIAQRQDNWGWATYSPTENTFDFATLGDRLRQFLPLGWPRARFVEDTAYGTTVAGQINMRDADRKNLAEGHGPMRFVDIADPALVTLTGPDGPALRNVESGAELVLPRANGLRRAKAGVLVWSPQTEPKTAALYDPKAWKVLATWSAVP